MGKIYIAIIFYCITLTVYATEYYVSSSTGNDFNDGITPETAWKTLSKVENERNIFLPGDVIAFKKGDIWNDGTFLNLSGIKGNVNDNIHFTSYGEGDKPIISVVGKPNITWINQGKSIWRTSGLHDQISRLMIDDKEVLGSWIYSEINTNISASGKLLSSLVRFVWDDIGDGYNVYLNSNLDPSKMNIQVSLDVRAMSLYDNSFLKFSDIEFQGGYIAGITVKACDNITFDNVKVGVMSRHGLTTEYSNTINKHCKNITIKNSLFDTEFTLDYSGTQKNNKESEQHGGSDGLAFRDCIGGEVFNNIFKNWGHSSLSFTSKNDAISETTLIKAYNNYLTSPDIAYGGRFGGDRNTHHNEIFNNTIENIRTSNQMNGHNNHIHHNIFKNNTHSPIKTYSYGELTVQGYSTNSYNNIFENNLFLNSENSGYFIGGDNYGSDVVGHVFRNNIIYNCGSYYANIGIWIESNNDPTYSNRGNIIQNNIVYNTMTANTIRYYNKNISVATFNKQTNYGHTIENTLTGNPNFVSTSNYHLAENSPAIDKGISPLSTKDYDGNLIPNDGTLPDIGIYEYYQETTGSVKAEAGADESICNGESVTLTASGGSSYSWNTGATTRSITVTPNVTTTYTVEVSEGSVTDTDSVVVTVNIITAGAGGNVTIEEGETVTLTGSGGESYSWNTGAITREITVSPTTTTTYTVIAIKGGCEDTASVKITVNGSSVTVRADAGEDQSICLGEGVTLTASGGSTYVWNTGATTQSITVTPDDTTTYTVDVSEGSVTDTDIVQVTVNNVTASAGVDKTIYEGESITLTASGGDTYVWNTGATTQSIMVTPTATTIFTVTAKKGDCEDTDTIQVTVNKKDTSPPPAKANAGEDQTICLGDNIKLTASGGTTYVWSTGETTKNINVNPTRTTSYKVTATRGGVTNSDIVVVTVENCSAISNGTKQEEMTVYPNPTIGEVNISVKNVSENITVFVCDAKGSLVYSENILLVKSDFIKRIDLSMFEKGVYFVGLNGTNNYEVKKIIVGETQF